METIRNIANCFEPDTFFIINVFGSPVSGTIPRSLFLFYLLAYDAVKHDTGEAFRHYRDFTRFGGFAPRGAHSNATAALICPGHVLIRAEIRPVQLESIAAITYWAGTVRFAGPVNGNTPLVEVVSAPRRVAGVPLVPTTQRSEELLANCAADSHVAPDASRAPHEPD